MRRKLSKGRLRQLLGLFFVALVVPTAVLIFYAYSQLKWEALHQHQTMAEELSQRIDSQLIQLIEEEEARPFAEYSFLNVAGSVKNNFLQRSPLSEFPLSNDLPGLIGYFQIDNRGRFTTPLLPEQVLPEQASVQRYGISMEEWQQRSVLQQQVLTILSQNRLVQEKPPSLLRSRAKKDDDETLPSFFDAAPSLSLRLETSPEEMMRKKPVKEGVIEADIVEQVDRTVSVQDTLQYSAQQKMTTGVLKGTTIAPLPQSSIIQSQDSDAEQEASAQAPFDLLAEEKRSAFNSLGHLDELQLNVAPNRTTAAGKTSGKSKLERRVQRKEQVSLPELQKSTSRQESVKITTFESEIDPFGFSQLDSGHFVLFRKVWRNGERYTQGILLNREVFIQGVIERSFKGTLLYNMGNLVVAYQAEVQAVFTGMMHSSRYPSAAELQGELLYQTPLSAPLSEMQLIYTINRLPAGAGASVIIWISAILILVLCLGFFMIYRLGIKQIAVSQQQQDFVSAVSHELKTPLTSIRMYSEMLQQEWASEEKKRSYYDYIFDESERLSRLINNVLQLARMDRNELQLNIKSVNLNELVDVMRSRVTSQLERAGFELNLQCLNIDQGIKLAIDPDAFIQIIINLVDNAVKFSAKAEVKRIDIGCKLLNSRQIEFTIRDFGPGIAKDQIKKIFRLFYRSENELTRETVGTGIGLALVHQLCSKMNGKIDVVNRDPGAEFKVSFPAESVDLVS